jgi:hypothetical protein
MRLYLVLQVGPTHSCWDCEGGTGVDWEMVQAADGIEAVGLVRGRLHLATYDDALTLYAFPLRESKGRKARLLAHSDFTLSPEAEASIVVNPPIRELS